MEIMNWKVQSDYRAAELHGEQMELKGGFSRE